MDFTEKKQKCIEAVHNSSLSSEDKIFIITFLADIQPRKGFDLMTVLSWSRTGKDIVEALKEFID